MSFRPTLRQEQRLTMAQRHAVELRMSQLHLELLNVIRDERYEPQARCPKCSRIMTVPDILRGFNRDPHDLTTECPKCHTRFESRLVCGQRFGVNVEMVFFCPTQTLFHLQGLEALDPETLLTKHQAVARSAIVHFGSLRNAFGRNNVAYAFEEKLDWSDKVVPFLGQLPDSSIASAVNVSRSAIRRLRIKHDVPACTKRAVLEEIEIEV